MDVNGELPVKKFRRVARVVKHLIQVCNVCRSIQSMFVTSESWFALLDNLVAATSYQRSKKESRAFVTVVGNEMLTFDVSEYRRHRSSDYFVTDEMRKLLERAPGTRSPEHISEIRRFLKELSQTFSQYPIPVQKQICQCAFYDKYHHNRVIIRRGLPPDGIYFVLSGTLIEKHEGKKQPVEITTGDKFGEEDLVCGCARRHTVITRHQVELLTIHRLDYSIIFNMSADSNNPRNLEICRHDVVFQHFPMHLLLESPGTWSTLRYKFGRLIVKDSNNVEWIYVIKSGEARVLKHLEPETFDAKERRQKIQQSAEEVSPFHRKLRLLSFVQGKETRQSEYRQSTYRPGRRIAMSAPSTFGHRHCLDNVDLGRSKRQKSERRELFLNRLPTSHGIRNQDRYSSTPRGQQSCRLPSLPKSSVNGRIQMNSGQQNRSVTTRTSQRYQEANDTVLVVAIEEVRLLNNGTSTPRAYDDEDGRSHSDIFKEIDNDVPIASRKNSTDNKGFGQYMTTALYRNAPEKRKVSRQMSHVVTTSQNVVLPPFVQVETLHPGQTFGMRAVLDPEIRGPSVSLVSGECEVLAINKKFFQKHCDEAMFSLIMLKTKPFPSQGELVDRLDANMQWEEFKQETLQDYLRNRNRVRGAWSAK